MLSWRKPLILISILSVVAFLGPAAAIASGPSAGDQQYIDPLGGSHGSHHSSKSSSNSGSNSGSSSTPSQPTASAPVTTTTPTPTVTTQTATTSTTTTQSPTATTATAGAPTGKAKDPKKLPFTGFDVWIAAALGLGMLASGLSLRRVARSH